MAISDELRKQVDLNNECCCEHCLSNKCKEWAINKGYELKSSKPIVSSDEGKQVFNYFWMAWLFKFDGGYESPKQILLPSFIGENEPKAIFKACQWILDNKEQK